MPKTFKNLMAGLAISTALTGGVVAMGATTSAANAGTGTQLSAGTSVLTGVTRCGRWRRCGWGGRRGGWGWRRERPQTIRILIHNNNQNWNVNRNRFDDQRFRSFRNFRDRFFDDDDD
ncbi:hypothetical protein [Nonomuraea helvata]|uniref:Uncharacterized protein n=1 Tax=Nonomuraea helvata TaxID=37484 RepID=A0ABV5RQR6_9ACTN